MDLQLFFQPSKLFLSLLSSVLQLVKNTTDNSRLHLIFDKKKYTYQFETALQRESFCLQIRQMKSLHSQEEDVDNISVFIGTWNMGVYIYIFLLCHAKCSLCYFCVFIAKIYFEYFVQHCWRGEGGDLADFNTLISHQLKIQPKRSHQKSLLL